MGHKDFSTHAMIHSFIVIKCKVFSSITNLIEFLKNNLLIAYYCSFNIFLSLPSYWTFNHFLKNFDNTLFSHIMKSQVLFLAHKGILDNSFIRLDSTPVFANSSQNNKKSFLFNKFKSDNQPKTNRDYKFD